MLTSIYHIYLYGIIPSFMFGVFTAVSFSKAGEINLIPFISGKVFAAALWPLFTPIHLGCWTHAALNRNSNGR